MKYHHRVALVSAALLACCFCVVEPGLGEQREISQPNILLLMTDQQRFDALSCYGCQAVKTPNLDRLATEGALFERCYSPSPICTPTRASLLTGKHVPGHGVYKLHDVLPDNEVMLPKRLQARGYETALVGKLHVSGLWHETGQRHPNDGFEHYHWCIDPGLNFDSPFNASPVKVRRRSFFSRESVRLIRG
jgi:arylsulfatase A-like enzyme